MGNILPKVEYKKKDCLNLKTELSETDFLQHYINNASHFMWLLGAGTSRTAGMPTAVDIIWDLKRRYYSLHENQDLQPHDINNGAIKAKIQAYLDSKGFPSLWSPEEYSFYFDLIFGSDYKAQQNYIHNSLSDEKISLNIGHRALAALMELGKARTVFTTNFDGVIEKAFAEVSGKSLPTFHLEGAYAALDALNSEKFPIYAKIHGDFRYQSIKNLSKDLLDNNSEIQKCFLASAIRFGLVVSGYSGRDSNVMSMLREAIKQSNAFPHGLYWTVPKISSAEESIKDLISYANNNGISAYIVEAGTFDEMLSKLWRHTKDDAHHLDVKVRTASVVRAKIPLPEPGDQFPILRTNMLPVIKFPTHCGSIELNGLSYPEIKSLMIENSPNAIWTYTDKLLFWGETSEVSKAFPSEKIKEISSFSFDDPIGMASESTFIKSFYEEALASSLCKGKPLFLRRKDRTYYAVVRHDSMDSPLFHKLKSSFNPIAGNAPGLRDVTWAECVSIRLEMRGGKPWIALKPDIWIKPLDNRKDAIDFLRARQIKRWNKSAYQLLDIWIEILLGSIGSGSAIKTCHQDTDNSASFEVGTRTAYSRGGRNGR